MSVLIRFALLADFGIDPGEPELIEIHNIIKR